MCLKFSSFPNTLIFSVNSIRGREVSGPVSRHRGITPNLYNAIQNQRITIGHLSAVYCLLFDHSGNYIITVSCLKVNLDL